MKRYIIAALTAASALALVGCDEEARIASQNLSTAADNFQVVRRITVLNTRSGQPSLLIEGACSQEGDRIVRIICKMPDGSYRKTIVSAAETDTVLSEQLGSTATSGNRYIVTINPAEILPIFKVR
jgi:hypothetical protein